TVRPQRRPTVVGPRRRLASRYRAFVPAQLRINPFIGKPVGPRPHRVALLKARRREPRSRWPVRSLDGAALLDGWTCPGLVDTWVKLPPLPVRAAARTPAG